MQSSLNVDYAGLIVSLIVDLVAISIFVGSFYARHRRKDLVMVFWFFNLCLFVTVAVIQMTEVAGALGFGLFAILSIIRLRSEPFNNRELGYFFGALVMGLLNGIGTPSMWFTLLLNAILVASMYVLDHPMVMPTTERRTVTFDRIVVDHDQLRQELGERLGVTVVDVTVLETDFVRDSMELEVTTRRTTEAVAAVAS